MRFIVVIPVYNGEQWIERCLDSIISQDYNDYEVIIIDDCSTDNTWDKISKYHFCKLHNQNRIGSGLANTVHGIQLLSDDPEDVIVSIDGDDYLADNNVLSYLNTIYQEDVWLTYGSFLPLSERFSGTCQPFEKVRILKEDGNYGYITLSSQTYRKSGLWVTSHLRTFKKWLWDKIDDKDLRDETGEYYKLAWDMSYMYPMIEMAGTHIRFIDKILYYYNDLNPICVGAQTPTEQIKEGEDIQHKPIYAELDSHIL